MVQTLETLKSQIESTQDLQSVVKTMKALAAVSIRQYEKAVASLNEYSRTVEMGLQIVLRNRYFSDRATEQLVWTKTASTQLSKIGVIVFGSDQGLCGGFNQQIVAHTSDRVHQFNQSSAVEAIACVGARSVPLITNAGLTVTDQFMTPTSVREITNVVLSLLILLEEWISQRQINRVFIFHNQPLSGAAYEPVSLQLLPLDTNWFHQLEQREWYTSMFPTFIMDWERLFSALIREYLFVSLYRTMAASLAAENASRLAAMQSAERNIEERLDDLNADYRRQRQSAITAELLDVVAGFEALT